MKSKYWSDSKVADWIRGTSRLDSGTCEEWAVWEKKAKSKRIRYWLAETAIDWLQNIFCWPFYLKQYVCNYISNRWIVKTHALTSHLKRGKWHDFDDRLLHSAFDELINFVEIEKAWMFWISLEDRHKQYPLSWFKRLLRGCWRNSKAGLDYLEWESQLKKDEDWGIKKNDPQFGEATPQACAAQETMKLYKWWKFERPLRPDPFEVSGLTSFNRGLGEPIDQTYRASLKKCKQIELAFVEEDTAMLICLIKIRNGLWT